MTLGSMTRPSNHRVLIWIAGIITGMTLTIIILTMTSSSEKTIHFEHRITTSIHPEELWRLLDEAFTDSEVSPIWPHDMEVIRSTGLQKGSVVAVTYRILGKETPLKYRIIEFKDGVFFRYEALPGHPFKGGAMVEIEKTPTGSILHWIGEYRYSGFSFAALFFKIGFEKRFFAKLEANLRLQETN